MVLSAVSAPESSIQRDRAVPVARRARLCSAQAESTGNCATSRDAANKICSFRRPADASGRRITGSRSQGYGPRQIRAEGARAAGRTAADRRRAEAV